MKLQGFSVLLVLIYVAISAVQARPNDLQEQRREFQYHQRSSRVSSSLGGENADGYYNSQQQAYGTGAPASLTDQLEKMAEKMRSEYNAIIASGNYNNPSTGKSYSSSMAMASSSAGGGEHDKPQAFSFSFSGKTKEQLDEIAKVMTHQIIAELNSGKLGYNQIIQPNWFEQRAAQQLLENGGSTQYTSTIPQSHRTVYHQSSRSQQTQTSQSAEPRVTSTVYYYDDEHERQRQQQILEQRLTEQRLTEQRRTQHNVASSQSHVEREQKNTQYATTYPAQQTASTVNVRTHNEEYYRTHPQTYTVTQTTGDINNLENNYNIQSNIPIYDKSYFLNRHSQNMNRQQQQQFQYGSETLNQDCTEEEAALRAAGREQHQQQTIVPGATPTTHTYQSTVTVENNRNTAPATQYTANVANRESTSQTVSRTSQSDRHHAVHSGSRPSTLYSYSLYEKYNEPDLKVSPLYRPADASTRTTEITESYSRNQANYHPQSVDYNSQRNTDTAIDTEGQTQVQDRITFGDNRQYAGGTYQTTRNSTESRTNVINRNEQRVNRYPESGSSTSQSHVEREQENTQYNIRYPARTGSTTTTTYSTAEQERELTEGRRDYSGRRPQTTATSSTTLTQQQELEAEMERIRLAEEQRLQLIEIEKIKALVEQHRVNQSMVYPGDTEHTVVTQREHTITSNGQDYDIGHRTELHTAVDYDDTSVAENTETNDRKNLFQTLVDTHMVQSEIERRNLEQKNSNVMSLVAGGRSRTGKVNTETISAGTTTATHENSQSQSQSNVMSMVGRNRPKIDLSDINSNVEERLRYLAETEREQVEEKRPNRTISRDRGDQPPSQYEADYESEEILEQEPGIGFYPVDKKPEIELFQSSSSRPIVPPATYYSASLAPYNTEEERRRFESSQAHTKLVEIMDPVPSVQNQRKEYRREFHQTTTTIMHNGQVPIKPQTHTEFLDVDINGGVTRSSSSSGSSSRSSTSSNHQESNVQRIEKRQSTSEPSRDYDVDNYQNQNEQQVVDQQQQFDDVYGAQQTMNLNQEILDLNAEYTQQGNNTYGGQEILNLNSDFNLQDQRNTQNNNLELNQQHQTSSHNSRYHQSTAVSGDVGQQRYGYGDIVQSNYGASDLGQQRTYGSSDYVQQSYGSSDVGQRRYDASNSEVGDLTGNYGQIQSQQTTFGSGQETLDLNSEFSQTQQQNIDAGQQTYSSNLEFGNQQTFENNQQTLDWNTQHGQVQVGFDSQHNYNSPYLNSQSSDQSSFAVYHDMSSTSEPEIDAVVVEVTSDTNETSTKKSSLWQRFKNKAKEIVG